MPTLPNLQLRCYGIVGITTDAGLLLLIVKLVGRIREADILYLILICLTYHNTYLD